MRKAIAWLLLFYGNVHQTRERINRRRVSLQRFGIIFLSFVEFF